jgi:hypothetical protein
MASFLPGLADRMDYQFAADILGHVVPWHPEMIAAAVHRILASCSPPRTDFDRRVAIIRRNQGY